MRRAGVALVGCLLLIGGGLPPDRAGAQIDCGFQLGFATLRELILEQDGDRVGECLENEHHNPWNGDSLQATTGGLMVWRKADNWTAFTDGWTTWLNGPYGLQTRLNSDQLFGWESPPPAGDGDGGGGGGGGRSRGGDGGGGRDGGGGGGGDRRPNISIDLSDNSPREDQQIELTLRASDDRGVTWIVWWAEDTGRDELRAEHAHDCGGTTECSATWELRIPEDGRISFRARAQDTAGQDASAGRDVRAAERDHGPDLELSLNTHFVDQGGAFQITVKASDSDGVDKIWWWATDTDDDDLEDGESRNCFDRKDCEYTWTESTQDSGRIVIRAKARDKRGNDSDERTQELQVGQTGGRPTVNLSLSGSYRTGRDFTISVSATSPKGVSKVRWWATDTNDDNMRRGDSQDCHGAPQCSESFSVRTSEKGDVTIHAKSEDEDGEESIELTTRIEVK